MPADDITTVDAIATVPRARATTPALTVTAGRHLGARFPLPSPAVVLGRSADADIQLTDHGVSRRHAKLVLASDGIANILDLHSTNGIAVNDVRTDLALLRDGDRVMIGPDAQLRFHYVREEDGPSPNRLSRRQLEVARHVAAGLSNAETARRLGVTARTVTSHLDKIYLRLGLHSRVSLVHYLARAGLLIIAQNKRG